MTSDLVVMSTPLRHHHDCLSEPQTLPSTSELRLYSEDLQDPAGGLVLCNGMKGASKVTA